MDLKQFTFDEKDPGKGTEYTIMEENKDIAIVGMAFELPQAGDAKEFWDNLKKGSVCLTEMPENRKKDILDYLSLTKEKPYRWEKGGFLKNIDTFDYGFFKITPKEARLMDPNQRLFLQTAWHALEDAGYINKIRKTRTGIYVGYGDDMDYYSMIKQIAPEAKDLAVTGNTKSITSGRLAHILDLKGPALNVDTACSSSLVAMHLACQGIQNGDCDMALAGGIRIFCSPEKEGLNLGIESKSESVRPFDETADGTVWGEGVVAFLLRPYNLALESGDHIYAIIKGSAINHDGNSIGLIAPNGKAQEKVLLQAWENAGIDPTTITYIESHGTGTKLGDPIEAKAINDAFRHFTDKTGFCAIGTLKANIGHLVECSGAASVVKAILALQHRELPPSHYFTEGNRQIDFSQGAIYLNKEMIPWEAEDTPRRCGISSFGFNGTNCHLVLEEYIPKKQRKIEAKPQVFTLSARTDEARDILIDGYIDYLTDTEELLEDICYTSNTGREHDIKRIIITAYTREELRTKLLHIREHGFVPDYENEYAELIKNYVQGEKINWHSLYQGKECCKVSMPGYPFEAVRCWITDEEKEHHEADFILQGKADQSYTETEKTVGAAIHRILGYREINIFDNAYQYGGDSVILLKVCAELNKYYEGRLKISDVISFSTVAGLAAYIDGNILNKQQLEKPVSPISVEEKQEINNKDIAVIGIAVKLPGIENTDDFWNMITGKKTTIGDFPEERRVQIKEYLEMLSEEYQRIDFEQGSYLTSVDEFDYEFFGIPKKDATLMDPNQRLFLQTAVLALTDAGYKLEDFKAKKVGVYTGSSAGALFNYGKMVYDLEPESFSMAIVSNHPSIIPGRVSYFLDLKGASMNVDTACSSSMTALSLACRAIRSGECEMAIAGGVHYDLAPIDIPGRKIGAESRSGKVCAFDETSDGILWGEGVGAVLLKPLSRAIEDRDGIYAVLEGIATNQDGASIGITAPNSLAQTDVIVNAWTDAGINPETISYIETHGTGTALGDPIEIEGIQRAFERYTDKRQFCALSSLKPNIGHLETASGIFSFIKAVLALKNRVLPPIAGLDFPNSRIHFLDTATYLNNLALPWNTNGEVRRCGISAFGFSGTNCHAIIREYPYEIEVPVSEAPLLLTISSRTREGLQKIINNYIKYLEKNEIIDIRSFCYTANTSNNNYKYRAAVIGRGREELKNKLEAIGTGNAEAETALELLCNRYCEGQDIDWMEYYKGETIRKVHIPSFVFEQEKCWLYRKGKNGDKPVILEGKDGEYSETEKIIAEIWSKAIGLDKINVGQDFYALGGHSITMMKIVSDIKEKLGYAIGYKDFSLNCCVSALAAFIDTSQKREQATNIIVCIHDEVNKYQPFPLTELQMAYVIGRNENLLFGGVSGHIYMEIETRFDIMRIEESLNKVIARHPMLHTIIYDNGTQQIMKDVPRYRIKIYDASNNSDCEREKMVLNKRRELSQHVLPLGQWPMFEVEAFRLSDHSAYIFIGIDVLIADGGSLAILGNEILAFYNEPECSLPKPQINMRDYVVTLMKLKENELYERDKAFWLAKMTTLPPAPIFQYRTELSEIGIPTFCRMSHSFSSKEWEVLQQISRKVGISAVSLLCGAYAEVLSYWTNQPQFTINFTIFNRYPWHRDVELVLGDFTSVMLIGIDMEREQSFMERARSLQMSINEALEHRHYDGVELIRNIASQKLNQPGPIMPFVFTSMLYGMKYPWDEIGEIKYGVSQTPQVYLDCQAISTNKGMMINWDYVEDIFEQSKLEDMFRQYIDVIQYLIGSEMEDKKDDE
jgi:acyl transferase domain-containing protein